MSLSKQAIAILRGNNKGSFTIPTQKLYPFQWNWDSGFTSLGISHYDINAAMTEIKSLLSGQWQNGMIPHILFHSENEKTYFPNHDFWQAEVNAGASKKPKTSGITQPPVLGFILEALLARHPKHEDLLTFAKEVFPAIVNSHRFFYSYRDPLNEGLAFIYHPWESGRDNSPLWDKAMDQIEINYEKLPNYERKDTALADAAHRPTSDQYDKFVHLLEVGKRHQYDGPGIYQESEFVIQDTLINTCLIKSNQSLINIGTTLGLDVGELKEWQSQSVPTFRAKFWSDTLNFFTAYDMRSQVLIPMKEIGGVAALFAEVASSKQAKEIEKHLVQLHDRGHYLCPSFDVDHPLFDSKRYWRGPIWPQMNWMVYHGLLAYGFETTAQYVKDDLIELVGQMGFYEYFECQKEIAKTLNRGYGGGAFSWTAACVLDLIENRKNK